MSASTAYALEQATNQLFNSDDNYLRHKLATCVVSMLQDGAAYEYTTGNYPSNNQHFYRIYPYTIKWLFVSITSYGSAFMGKYDTKDINAHLTNIQRNENQVLWCGEEERQSMLSQIHSQLSECRQRYDKTASLVSQVRTHSPEIAECLENSVKIELDTYQQLENNLLEIAV